MTYFADATAINTMTNMSVRWMALVMLLIANGLSGQQLDRRQGEILIQVKEDLNPLDLRIDYSHFKGKETNILLSQVISRPLNIWKISFDFNRINEYDFKNEVSARKEAEHVSFNYLSRERKVPDDPRFIQQWQYINDGSSGGIPGFDTDADLAWDITTGGLTANGDTIVVCVIDNGVDFTHEDLIDNMWINYADIPDNGIDDDNNGYIDDHWGWDAINDDGDVTREGAHGTSVVGIVGAVGNNALGVAGVNWDVKVMNIRGGSTILDGIKSYAYAYEQRRLYNESNGSQGAYVVATNASWGFDRRFEDEAPMFCAMYDELGMIGISNVAATSNEEVNVDEEGDLPTHCSSPYLIGMTNLSKSGTKVGGSAFSTRSIDMAAPGESVITTSRNNNYSGFTGTSGSAPLVAGTIALMHSTPCSSIADMNRNDPAASVLLIKDIILGSVTQNENLLDFVFTAGHLNIANAVNIADELCNPCTPPDDVIVTVTDGSSAQVSWNQNGSGTDVRYRQLGNLAWKTANSSTSPLSLSQLEGCTRYEIQFRAKCGSNGPYSYSYYFQTEDCCKNPENIYVDQDGDDLIVSWDRINSASEYRLEFKSIIDQEWSHVMTSENSFTFRNLNSCSGYSFRLQTNCGEELPLTRSINGNINCNQCSSNNYCLLDLVDNSFEHINSISVGSSMISTGKNQTGYVQNIGYSGILLTQGKMVDVSIVPGFSDGAFTEYMAIFVDWNQNGTFEEEERAFSPEAASSEVSGQIMVPMDAMPGITRMRVILSYDDIKGSCTADGIEFGEVEDYCVTINTSTECSQSIQVEEFSTTSTSVELIWTAVDEATDYNVEFRRKGVTDWEELVSNGSTAIISDLERNQEYEFRIKANCDGVDSDFSEIITIKTRLGTSTIDQDQRIYQLWPNPFAERLNIELSSSHQDREVEIDLYDAKGQKVLTRRTRLDGQLIQMDGLSLLNNGIYIIRIKGATFSIMEKVIKI